MKIFFSGIGGSGVSAIAGFMADRGHTVIGSDRLFDSVSEHPLSAIFRSKGIAIVPQDGSGISADLDKVIFSTAVEKTNPDFVRTASAGLPLATRPEFLADIVTDFRTVAVAGTSGKSTMSGMLAFLMQELGMSPNFIGGGRVKQFRTPLNPGNYLAGGSDILVIEACESDGTIVNYRPVCSIIANLDLDHHSIEETAGMFRRLEENTRDFTVVGADDRNLASFGIRGDMTFGIDAASDYRAEDISFFPLNTIFRLRGVRFDLRLPGRHNLLNALACIAVLSERGVGLKDVADALQRFAGIERRFDIHLNNGRHLVIDDYAHNPHKMSSLIETVRKISDAVCYIFQPHGYGPTRLMKDGYIDTFSRHLRISDRLLLLPIYYAGGTAPKDISSADLADGINKAGGSVCLIRDRREILSQLGQCRSVVVLGARDDSLSALAGSIAEQLREK